MGRLLIIISLFFAGRSLAQLPADACKQVREIALREQIRHQSLLLTPANAQASANFDIKYYRCEWDVDPSVRYIKGKVTAWFRTLTPATSVVFDLSQSLTTDSVVQRGVKISFSHNANALQVNFPASLAAGVLDSVTISYKGIPGNSGFGSFIQFSHAGVPVIWTLSEPYGSQDWWPCKNGLDDKADSLDIFITCPAAYRAASNGLLQSEGLVNGNSQRLVHWKHRYPIASYLVAFAVTNYAVFNNTVQLGNKVLPMQTYCYPENLASFQQGTQNTLDAMQLFTRYFGEYPFINEKYGHVQFGWGGGMEHQTCSFVVSIDEGLCAHELAHQWFGDKITCGSWQDIWLNEGFATFLASMYTEEKYPANTLNARRAEIDFITSQPEGSVKVSDTTQVGRIFDWRLSYLKGSHVLYMLRLKLGDSAFFKGLRTYLSDPALQYGFARTIDLQKHLEASGGKSLNSFFKQWYEGQGHPSYQINWNALGSRYINITINQTSSHSSVPFFELPLPITCKKGSLEKKLLINHTVNGESFIREIGFVPDTVLFDPEYWLISRNNTVRQIANPVITSNQITVYPNPIGSRFYIYAKLLNATRISVSMYNASGQLVYKAGHPLINGTEFLEISSASLAAGSYTLRIEADNGFVYHKKLIR